jgi:hypothetical protein
MYVEQGLEAGPHPLSLLGDGACTPRRSARPAISDGSSPLVCFYDVFVWCPGVVAARLRVVIVDVT